jgi:hypothetical protein
VSDPDPNVGTVRSDHITPTRGRTYRSLARVGLPRRLAALHGTLMRARTDEQCDFVVEGPPGNRTRVRLAAAHQIGSEGDAVVIDTDGQLFATEGDNVVCVGGLLPGTGLFHASELRVLS